MGELTTLRLTCASSSRELTLSLPCVPASRARRKAGCNLIQRHARLLRGPCTTLARAGDGKPYGKTAGPNNALGFHTKRCKRCAMFVDDGTVKVMQVAEAADDPAGDARPEASCVENMLELIGKL